MHYRIKLMFWLVKNKIYSNFLLFPTHIIIHSMRYLHMVKIIGLTTINKEVYYFLEFTNLFKDLLFSYIYFI